jgi:uncharacterized membrane protein YgcG
MVMIQKKLGLLVGVVALLAVFVLATAGDGVKMISPASGTNYTGQSAILFNVTFTNASDLTDPQNASIYINLSGTWSLIGNVSCQTATTTSYCAGSITNTTIPDGIYSINATLANTSTTTSILSDSNLSTVIYIDATPPQVATANISNPVSYSNHSGLLYLNVSVYDALVGIGTVRFNITNATDVMNATVVTATAESTTRYSLSINTSYYSDGYYNFTVYANDTLGNLNNTAKVFRIIFDNIAPSLTFSCDDYTVEEDDTITCTCSGNDSLSGMNASYGTSGVSFTTNPATSTTGNNKQTTCTGKDLAGNSATSTRYYNVSDASSSGSSSSGGSSSSSSSSSASSNSSASTTSSSSSGSSSPETSAGLNQTNGTSNILPPNQGNQANADGKKAPIILIIAVIVFAIIVAIGLIIGIKRLKDQKRGIK